MKKMILALAVAVATCGASTCEAGLRIKVKVPSLGNYQQKVAAKAVGAAVGAGVTVVTTPALGPAGGRAAGEIAGHAVSRHAEQNWTGRGLDNWRRPRRW